MANFDKYKDNNGLLNQILHTGKLDGGDSAHKTAHYAIYAGLNKNLKDLLDSFNALSKLETAPGVVVRNPNKAKWYSNPLMFSRDQATPYLIAYALRGAKEPILRFMKKHLRHLFLFAFNQKANWQYPTFEEHEAAKARGDIGQNVVWNYKSKLPDITFLEFFGIYIRGLRLYPLYPILLLSDMETLIGSIVKYFQKTDNDVANGLAVNLLAREIMPTPFSYISRKITKLFVKERMNKYFGVEGEPPLHEYAKEIMENL